LLYPKGGSSATNVIKKVVPETTVNTPKPPVAQSASSSPKAPVYDLKNNIRISDKTESYEIAATAFPKRPLEFDSIQNKVLNAKKDVSFNDIQNDTEFFKQKSEIQPKESFAVGRLNDEMRVSNAYRSILGQSHELTHDMVIRHEPNKFPVGIAITTSAVSNKDEAGEEFIRISSTKMNGDFLPARNKANDSPMDDYGLPINQKKIKRPTLVDNYGDNHPDPERGGQFIAPLKSPRVLEATNAYTKNDIGTELINSPEVLPIIQQINEKSKTRVPIARRHKEDSSFFTEDGQEILD
jgi:hypothetical protein